MTLSRVKVLLLVAAAFVASSWPQQVKYLNYVILHLFHHSQVNAFEEEDSDACLISQETLAQLTSQLSVALTASKKSDTRYLTSQN
jgi:hypothetical protein